MEQTETKRLHAVIHGRVQGVGFRAFTISSAARLNLTGWVRNRFNGTVETIAEGSQIALETFLNDLRRGPGPSNVTNIDSDWQSPTGEFFDFRPRMTR